MLLTKENILTEIINITLPAAAATAASYRIFAGLSPSKYPASSYQNCHLAPTRVIPKRMTSSNISMLHYAKEHIKQLQFNTSSFPATRAGLAGVDCS